MAGKSIKLCVIFFVILFAVTVSAQVYVNISPVEGEELLELYPDEVAEYEIVVLNSNPYTIENFNMRVVVDEGLAIVDGLEDVQMKSLKVASLDSGRSKRITVKVKALKFSTGQYYISVNSGFERYTNLDATYLTVKENKVLIGARLSKTALNIAEENSVFLDIKNNSEYPVQNLVAILLTPPGIKNKSTKLELNSLASGEGFTDKEFEFEPEPGTIGERNVVLRVTYALGGETHTIEKNFTVEIQNRDIILYIIIILVLILVIMSLMTRKKSKKKKESIALFTEKKIEPEASPQ